MEPDSREVELKQRLEAYYVNAIAETVDTQEGVDPMVAVEEQLYSVGKYAEAITALEATHGYQTRLAARRLLGQCRFALKDLAGAEKEFEAAVTIANRLKSLALVNLAIIKNELRRCEEALVLLDEAIAEYPQHSLPWLNKLAILNLAGETTAISEVFRELNTKWPQWRENTGFRVRLRTDPHLVGVESTYLKN